ncbi:hypothetical protein B0H14DRAFT_2781943 [Mycena olivaceomarginata]|nr:hypothetical protein B0H14DRAFT_2781943 [Mycena olivaceomarginata]
MMTCSSIPAQRVLPYVVSMILLQFIDIMIFPSTWTDQCQMCGVPRHPSAAWSSSFLTSTRSFFWCVCAVTARPPCCAIFCLLYPELKRCFRFSHLAPVK